MLKQLLLRDPCIFRSSASSDKLDWESNDENFGERFMRESTWLWITFTDWTCGIFGRAPVKLLFKELVVANFNGDVDDDIPIFVILLLALSSFPFKVWILFDDVMSCLRKCLNEKGFSLGASDSCLKSFFNNK